MKRLLSTTVLVILAAGSLTACSGGEPDGQPSTSAGSSISTSPSVSPTVASPPTRSGSPAASGSPTTADTATTDPSDVVVETVDGNWLTSHAENAVAIIENEGNVEGFDIVLGGSGTKACAPAIKEAAVEGTSLAIVLLTPARDQICTADLRPYNFRVLFPDAEKIEQVFLTFDMARAPYETFTQEDFISVPE